jgi:hypothetical protein
MDKSHDSHCALSEEEEGGIVSSYLYRGIIVMSIVTSAQLSLLMHSSDGHADVIVPIATNNARRYCGLRPIATN